MSNKNKCSYEGCPGFTAKQTVLAYHREYLFLHRACLPFARAAAKARHETFGLRRGI